MAVLSQQQYQSQKQIQKLSHLQIQALNMLSMSTDDLKEFIAKAASDNPALEIVYKNNDIRRQGVDSNVYQQTLESTEDKSETLQSHLMHQLNLINLTKDEYELSQKLIYNLDPNGFYGSMLAPETLLNKKRPVQDKKMLAECIDRIQKMDPVGVCCKGPEESLYVQAKNDRDCPEVALFILDGHLDLLNPPEAERVFKKLQDYQKEWHSKKFAGQIILDTIPYDEDSVQTALDFILRLNPHPAQGYTKDTNDSFEAPDIVLRVEKVPGYRPDDDFSRGLVSGDMSCHFQVKYASGVLPELRVSPDFSFDKENTQKALELISSLQFRESTIVLQGCAIVKKQKEFFLKGENYLAVLNRKDIADILGIHESTVSRMSAKNGSKYIQTEWGLFPASYFFPSGVAAVAGDGMKTTVSSTVIEKKIAEILKEQGENKLSDSKLTQMLNESGIKIARRTVTKYRSRAGIRNSYER